MWELIENSTQTVWEFDTKEEWEAEIEYYAEATCFDIDVYEEDHYAIIDDGDYEEEED